jgi:uncharacterized membrane protein YkvI
MWKIVFVIIGTLIGAGFASGQEIYLFFFSYGLKGIIGIVISSLLIVFVIYKTLEILKKSKSNTYLDFLDVIMNSNFKEKNNFLNLKNIINKIINLFILITFFIMVAGFGAYFEQEFGINSLIGSSILALLSFIVFMTNTKGVIKANEILVPILIIFLVIIGFINLKNVNLLKIGNYVTETNNLNFILSAVLYCSYNSILLIPVLITLKDFVKSKKQIISVSLISSVIAIILSLIIFLLLVRVDVDITELEMPAVYVVSNMFKFLRLVYGFIILGSIFTTSVSLGNSFLQNTVKSKKGYTQIAAIMCIISVLVSKIGFSNLINLLYPVFGYLGLIQILKIGLI